MPEQRIDITEAGFADIAAIHALIPEFTPEPDSFFAGRCNGRRYLALKATRANQPAGYSVYYDRYRDGSLYCWMAAVIPDCRRLGVYSALAAEAEHWARHNGFTAMRIKTRNNRREMLRWLVNNGYDFLAIDPREPIADSRIHLLKSLR